MLLGSEWPIGSEIRRGDMDGDGVWDLVVPAPKWPTREPGGGTIFVLPGGRL